MSVPPVGAVPALANYELYLNGLTFGGNGVGGISLVEIDGLDLNTPVRAGDNNRARDHGQWIGYDFLGGRDITIKFDLFGTSASDFASKMQAISTATLPGLNKETPFYFNIPGFGVLASMVRPTQRSWKLNYAVSAAQYAKGMQMQLHATDPRFYTTPTQTAVGSQSNIGTLATAIVAGTQYTSLSTTALLQGVNAGDTVLLQSGGEAQEVIASAAASVGAVTIDIDAITISYAFPVGTTLDPSTGIILDNIGNFDCRPLVELTGAAPDPTLTIGANTVQFTYTTASSYDIWINTDQTKYAYDANNANAPVQVASGQWGTLLPGSTSVSTTATAINIYWASAWIF